MSGNRRELPVPDESNGAILHVDHLRTHFFVPEGVVRAVEDVSFELKAGEVLGVVGESGCGKSVTALSILRLVDPPGRIVSGEILFRGRDLAGFDDEQMREIRGKRISMIFQDPMTSLNPLLKVGAQLTETILAHEDVGRAEARARAVALLRETGIPAPERRIDDYPHQFSGGMRQRVMIATALACSPDIVVADEATTALDVTIQAQILDIFRELVRRLGTSVLFITHDLGIVAQMCDKVLIMYAGKLIEKGTTVEIFDNPLHPYTVGLLASLPEKKRRGEQLYNIRGVVPVPIDLPESCYFHERCEKAIEGVCDRVPPAWTRVTDTHEVFCHLYPANP